MNLGHPTYPLHTDYENQNALIERKQQCQRTQSPRQRDNVSPGDQKKRGRTKKTSCRTWKEADKIMRLRRGKDCSCSYLMWYQSSCQLSKLHKWTTSVRWPLWPQSLHWVTKGRIYQCSSYECMQVQAPSKLCIVMLWLAYTSLQAWQVYIRFCRIWIPAVYDLGLG